MDPWMHGCMDAGMDRGGKNDGGMEHTMTHEWRDGYMDTWIHGLMDAWRLVGGMDAWVHGWMMHVLMSGCMDG